MTIGQQVSFTCLELLCGGFVVAVSFADGNVCANGAWDRVIRVVGSCGKSDVAQLLSCFLPSFVKLIFVDAFSLQIAVLCDGGSLPCQK